MTTFLNVKMFVEDKPRQTYIAIQATRKIFYYQFLV